MEPIHVSALKRFWIKLRGEDRDAAYRCPAAQLNEEAQLENRTMYYRMAYEFERHPECSMINGFEKHESEKADCFLGHPLPVQTSGYPYYSFLSKNFLYVVGFTGLHYFSFMLQWPFRGDRSRALLLCDTLTAKDCVQLDFNGFRQSTGYKVFEQVMLNSFGKKPRKYELTSKFERAKQQIDSKSWYVETTLENDSDLFRNVTKMVEDVKGTLTNLADIDLSDISKEARNNGWWFVKITKTTKTPKTSNRTSKEKKPTKKPTKKTK